MKSPVILLLLIFLLTIVNAVSINYNFDINQNQTQDKGIIYEDSLVFQVSTYSSHVLCRYSGESRDNFDLMESFDDNFETVHKKTFTELSSGVYRYYVRCRDVNDLNNESLDQNELEAMFTISNRIAAVITLSDTTITSGEYDISVQTTKVPSGIPKLSYSYNGVSYTPITLSGSGKEWQGHLVISDSPVEEVGSFKFEATDLEGRQGERIFGDRVFIVDTKLPPTFNIFDAIGEYSQIKLDWYVYETSDIDTINIYRSEEPNVVYSDLYKRISGDNEDYTDNDVTNGKTYYYKIAAEDSAGNVGELSRELMVTSRRDNSSTQTGLALNLLGSVDALLVEIDLLDNDVEKANSLTDYEEEDKKEYATVAKITTLISDSKTELVALRREVSNYKLQDLTKEVLDAKLASSRVKLNILRKKIPETINFLEKTQREMKVTEEAIRNAIVVYAPELTPSLVDKSVKESLKIIEEEGLKIKTVITPIEIISIDGTKIQKTIVEHNLDSTLERAENQKFILRLPSEFISADSLDFIEGAPSILEDSIVSFETDTKKVTYLAEKSLSTSVVQEISIVPTKLVEENSPFTGYFLSEIPSSGSFGIGVLVLITASLIGYMIYMRKNKDGDIVKIFLNKAKKVKELQNQGKSKEANSLYNTLKIDYMDLTQKEKSKVFQEIKQIAKNSK